MVIRPKSIATVVVRLVSTPEVSSMSMPRSVSVSSVRSGRVSETEPTMVVLPAPKPPEIRILIAVGSRQRSERPKSIEHRPVHLLVSHVHLGLGFLHGDEPLVEQVAQQDTDRARR